MQQHPVAWQRIGTVSHIFPYRAGGNTCPCSWTVNEILVFVSHLSPVLRLQRLNRSKTDAYRYSVTGGGDPLLQIELNETLQWGCIELVHPPPPVTRVISQVHGQPIIFYVLPRFVPGMIADRRTNSILRGLFNSLRVIIQGKFKNYTESSMVLNSLFGIHREPATFCKGLNSGSQFTEFVKKLKGYLLCKVDDKLVDTRFKPARQPILFDCNGRTVRLVSMVWLSPRALSVIGQFSYCELDATFYVLKPYVACVPQFIYMNCAFPIGLIIGTSENWQLYEMLFEGVVRMIQRTRVAVPFKFDVLSDAGGALRSFCQAHSLRQFQCHRHLIEWFGCNSVMKVMFLKLLRSKSLEEFHERLRIANSVYLTLKEAGNLPQNVETKYLKFTGQEVGPDGQPVEKKDHLAIIAEWGLWARDRVTTCSNHAEAFHRVLKAAARPHGKHLSLPKCLVTTYETIVTKQEALQATFTRNFASYRRGKDRPADWEYLREVARRFEIPIPEALSNEPDMPEEVAMNILEEVGASRLAALRITDATANLICEFSRWTGPDFPGSSQEDREPPPEDELNADATSIRVQIAKDIYATVASQIALEDPYAWVFHWTQHAIEQAELDPEANPAQAYIVAYQAVMQELAKRH